MTTILLMLIQLLSGTGIPLSVNSGGEVVFGAPQAPRSDRGKTHREDGDQRDQYEQFGGPCDISNGF
jgi:hypothetical protein